MGQGLPTKRLAVIDLGRSCLAYSGLATHLMSLIQCAEAADFQVDIFLDIAPQDRKKFIPPEYYPYFEDHVIVDSSVKSLGSSARLSSAYSIFYLAKALSSLFISLRRKVYHFILFNEINLAKDAIFSGLWHPAIWVYLHQHEVFMDYEESQLIPPWKREILRCFARNLPVRGYLVQCENNVRLVESVLRENSEHSVLSCPITLPGCKIDYSNYANREGIAFVGSGESIKNPELAIKVLNALGSKETVHFYLGRGIRTIKKELQAAKFQYVIHEKLSRTEMFSELSKRKAGIHTAKCEGYGLAIAEQMNYYPMLIWGDTEYAAHFPSACKFSSVEEGADALRRLLTDRGLWETKVKENEAYLKFNDVQAVGEVYSSLIAESNNTPTGAKVQEIVEKDGIVSYELLLSELGWQDAVMAASWAARWPGKRIHMKDDTYFVSDSFDLRSLKVDRKKIDGKVVFSESLF